LAKTFGRPWGKLKNTIRGKRMAWSAN